MKDYYKILGIKKTSNKETIKSAYKAKVFKYHPDKNKNLDDYKKKLYKTKFNLVNEAYTVLSDSYKRGRYDANMEKNIFKISNTNDSFKIFDNFFSDFNRKLKIPNMSSKSYNSFSSYTTITNVNGEKKVSNSYKINNDGKKNSFNEEYVLDKEGNKKQIITKGDPHIFRRTKVSNLKYLK